MKDVSICATSISPTHNILYFLLATFHSTLPEIKLTFKSQFIAKYVQYYQAFAPNFCCFWCIFHILIKCKLLGGLNCILLEQYNCFSKRRQGSVHELHLKKNIHPSIHLFLIIKFRKLHPPSNYFIIFGIFSPLGNNNGFWMLQPIFFFCLLYVRVPGWIYYIFLKIDISIPLCKNITIIKPRGRLSTPS